MTNVKDNINDVETMLKNSKVFNGNILTKKIDQGTISQLNMGYASDGQMTSGYSSAIEKLASSYNEATAEANALKMAQDGLAESTVKDILVKQNWSKAEIDAAISSQAFTTAQQKSTINTEINTQATWKNVAATKALTIVKKVGSAIGGMLATTAIATGVSLLISGIVKLADNIIETKKEIKEAAEAAKQSIDDIKSSFDDLEEKTNNIKQRYAELAQGVDQLTSKNLTLSTDDYKDFLDMSNQLSTLFPTLTKNYDENGNAILDLNGDVGSIVSSLDDLIERQRRLANAEMLENLPSVYKNYVVQIDEYTKKLEEAKEKQKGYQELYKRIKESDYEVSEDKREVTFSFKDLTNEEKAKIPEYLTSNMDDVQHLLMKDLDDGITTATLFLDKEFNGFGARLQSAQEEISKYTSLIESEVSSFSSYMNTWLEDSWEFQQIDDTKMQQALKQVLFNKDWIDIAKSELEDDATWEDIASWIETNYIKAINNIQDGEMKQSFIELFTLDLPTQTKIDLATKLQEHFNQNDIVVSLDFVLDKEDPSSSANLLERFQRSRADIAAYDKYGFLNLKEYTKDFTEKQMEIWLRVTNGIVGANKAITKYEEEMAQASQYDAFFTETNNSLIDDYIGKINDLTGYYNKLHTVAGLSENDKIKLNQSYGIISTSSEGYQHAILQEISMLENYDAIIVSLRQAIETCTDAKDKARLETLLHDLTNLDTEAIKAAEGFDNISNAMSNLKSRADLLRDVNQNMQDFGKIDAGQLNEILELFPELETQVALYSAGLMSSTKLFAMMTEAYQSDADLYAEAMVEKLQYNASFYSSVYDKLPQHIKDLAESYGLDIENYRTMCVAKLELEGELAKKRAELYDTITEDYNISKDKYASTEEKKQVHTEYQSAQKSYDEVSSVFNSIMETAFGQFTTNWKNFGQDSKQKVDWVDQSLSVLQEQVDDMQTALENTHGLDAQIQAIDNLNGALKVLQKGYKKAYKEYNTRYTEGLNKLSNPTEIKRKIESGESFKLKEYSAEDAEIIQGLIDLYDKMREAEDKMAELGIQINDNESLEKSKLRQENYESLLENVQTKLEDQTLSTSERNDLLADQLLYQQAINEELAKQAEYEGDTEGAAALRKKNEVLSQEANNNTLQDSIDEKERDIAVTEKKLANDNLTQDKKDSLHETLKAQKDHKFQLEFQQMRDKLKASVWDSYIESLKEDYGESNMDTDKFIQKHLKEISEYFGFTGMEDLYYDYVNTEQDSIKTSYDTSKDTNSYYINDNNNKIQDIQNKIDLNGGIGSEQDYTDMITLNESNMGYWERQKAIANEMLEDCEEGTQAWNDWNAEVQECENNIANCQKEIHNCQSAILKLPLNDIESKLRFIENQLDDINEMIEYNNTYIAAANYILDKEIRGHEKAKEAIQDQLDALEKSNNARQTSLALQQAEYNLRKAENQRSAKVFVEGKGWEYQSDPDEIRSAQANYEQALYDNKVSILNEQIRLHDEEVKKLNRIKDNWGWIVTEAEGLTNINKARLYDYQFEEKVLSGNAILISTITDNMKVYYSTKSMYEDEQKRYQKLQDVINDTSTEYDLQAIGYEEAKRKITDAIKLYYPEIFTKYGEESAKIDEIINKKMEEAGIQEETSKAINDTIDESNAKMVESYSLLVDDLNGMFKKLNKMLKTYGKNTEKTATKVGEAISQIQSAINGLSSLDATISITNSTSTEDIQTAGKSHSGLELGYLGETSTSQDKDAFRYIALDKLDDSELVRLVQKGEAVLTEPQISTVMSNFRNLAQVRIPSLQSANRQTNQSINFNGNIVIQNPVGDSSSLAHEIKQNLGNNILQELYKK